MLFRNHDLLAEKLVGHGSLRAIVYYTIRAMPSRTNVFLCSYNENRVQLPGPLNLGLSVAQEWDASAIRYRNSAAVPAVLTCFPVPSSWWRHCRQSPVPESDGYAERLETPQASR